MVIIMKPTTFPKVRGIEGKWVLVVGDRVVRQRDRAEELFEEALQYPAGQAVVTKVLSAGASFY